MNLNQPYWAMSLEERKEYFGQYQLGLMEFLGEFDDVLSFADKHKIEGEIHRVASFIRGLDTKPSYFHQGLGEGCRSITVGEVASMSLSPKEMLKRFNRKNNVY